MLTGLSALSGLSATAGCPPVTVDAPIFVSTGALPAPAVTGDATVSAPVFAAVAEFSVPTISAGATVAAPIFASTGDMPAPTVTGAGPPYFSIQCDGAHGYLQVPNADTDIGSGVGISFSCWLKFASTSGEQVVFDGNSNVSWAILMESGVPYFGLRGATSVNSGYTITGTAWHHLAITCSTTTVTFYVDATSVGSGPFASVAASGSTYGIGGIAGGAQFNGLLADFRIYNRVLSGSDVTAIRGSGQISEDATLASGLKRRYQMSEGSGTTVADTGSDGQNGTLIQASGFPTWSSTIPS